METHIFRVRVRGRFDGLTADDRRRLLEERPTDRLPRFSEDGDLSHDGRPDFFTYRFQLRQRAESAEEAAEAVTTEARRRALADLDARGVGHRDLKVSVQAMADYWR